MKKLLKIYNSGLLDINELRLMGCSNKTGSDTIGKYGTGAKYGIAVLTRENINFNIFIGKHKVNIQTEDINIRGKVFQKIIIDFEGTSLTTNLGVEWTVGQGLREFIANAMDSGGGFEIIDEDELSLYDSQTTITFELDQVEEYLEDFDFDNWTKVGAGYYYKKLDTPRVAKVFKEGFLVYEAENNSSYDYRIDSLKINESRVAEDRYEVKRGIAKIQGLMDKEDVKVILEKKETNLATFYNHDDLGEGWKDVKTADIKNNEGYELKRTVKRNIANYRTDLDEVSLVFGGYTHVSFDTEVEDGVYMQDEYFEAEWDFDTETNNIFLGKRYSDSHGVGTISNADYDYGESLKEAKKYRRANMYIQTHNLTTVNNAVSHFLDRQQLD